jgi:hypothetical protein
MAKKTHCKRGHPRTPENLRSGHCKICRILTVKSWRRDNPDRQRAIAYNGAWRQKGIDFTFEEAQIRLRKQNFCCDLCGEPFNEETPCADHDHKTKKVRALVHKKCNFLLGQAQDKPWLLRRAAEYLERHGG